MTAEVKLFDNLDDVLGDANGALDRDRQQKLYDRLEWLGRTQAHCDLPGKPLIVRARNTVGTAWLFLQQTGRSHAEALASWYTLDFDIVTEGLADHLGSEITKNLKHIAHITLHPVADPEPIGASFRANGWRVFAEPATVNWVLNPPDDFETYWASRPSRLRNTVKRKAKKAKLDIVIHRDFDESGWDDYRAIYAKSWKPEEGSWGFMRDFADAEGTAGTLRLGVAYKDGEAVAAQLWHVENGRATIHKLAYTEETKALSPGSILSEAMFRHVIERDRPDIIDYGTGNEGYKADWMDEARPLYRLEIYNPGRLASWPALAKRALSGLVRRGARG